MVIPIFRFFIQLYRSCCTPEAVAREHSSCSQVKTGVLIPAGQSSSGRQCCYSGKLKPGRGELQLLCAGGSVAGQEESAQEGERELNPGVTSGLS